MTKSSAWAHTIINTRSRMSHDEISQLYDKMLEAFDEDQAALTVVLAREILDRDPDHFGARFFLAKMLYLMSRYEEAIPHFESLLETLPAEKTYMVLSELGHLHRYRGNFEKAADYYQQTISVSSDDATGYIYLGAIRARQGRLHEAETIHRYATGCEQGLRCEAYHNLGLVLRGQERLVEAKASFEKAIEIDPDYVEAHEALEDVISVLDRPGQRES